MLAWPSYNRFLCALCTAYRHLYGPIHCACIHLQTVNLHVEWIIKEEESILHVQAQSK